MSLRNHLILLLLLIGVIGCKSADSILQTTNACRLNSYTYKAKSKLNPLGGNTQTDETRTYSYNSKGELIGYYSLITGSVTSSSSVITSSTSENKLTYELDNNGFITKVTSEYRGSSTYNNIPTTTTGQSTSLFQYDVNGRLVQKDITNPDPTSKTQQNYTYDNNGKLLLLIVKDFTNLGSYTYKYYYTNGILSRYTVSSSSSTQEVEPYKLDKAGHIIQYGPDTDPSEKLTYDEKGNILRYATFNFAYPFRSTDYEYDNMQNPFSTVPIAKGIPDAIQSTRFSFEKNANNMIKRLSENPVIIEKGIL